MININELRQSLEAVTPEEIAELLDRLEAAESDALEQARLLGMSGEREAALLARLEAAEKERDALRTELKETWHRATAAENTIKALRAKIERMEEQEPAGQFIQHPSHGMWEQDGYGDNPDAKPLYALPGAQPAPSVPEGFAIVNAAHSLAVLDREDWRTAKNRAELRAMLSAAPKPEGE